MKKAAVLILVLLSSTTIWSQSTLPVRFSIRAGVNVSNSTWDINSELADKKFKMGFQVGVMADYTFPTPFGLQSGLFLTTKGAKLNAIDKLNSESLNQNQTLNQIYLEMPIYATYKMYVTRYTCIFFNLGPYLAYGIGGNNKVNTKLSDGNDVSAKFDTFGKSEDIKYGNLKKFDFGLGGGVGFETGHLIFSLTCELGLANLSRNDLYGYKNISSLFGIGYQF